MNRPRGVFLSLALALSADAAMAQDYPAKPIRLILRAEHAKWGRVVKESGAKAD